MKKYKIEFEQRERYVIDVKAKTEKEAIKKAEKRFDEIEVQGIKHNYNNGDGEFLVHMIYDVTDTDDPFNEA